MTGKATNERRGSSSLSSLHKNSGFAFERLKHISRSTFKKVLQVYDRTVRRCRKVGEITPTTTIKQSTRHGIEPIITPDPIRRRWKRNHTFHNNGVDFRRGFRVCFGRVCFGIFCWLLRISQRNFTSHIHRLSIDFQL